MSTTSFPAVGVGGLSGSQWSVMYGTEDGIVEDYHAGGVEACILTRSGDTATISAGKVKVNGYVLSIDSPTDLSLPTVTTTTTYYINAVYDDNLNVEVAGTDNADPLGPCRLEVSAGPPAPSTSRTYYTLYTVTRAAGQALTAATVDDQRQWVAAVRTARTRPPLGSIPRGTHLIVVNRAISKFEHWVMEVNTGGTGLGWVDLLNQGPFAFSMPSSLVSRDASPSAVQYFRFATCMVGMRGSVKRSSGSNLSTGSDVTLGTMPVGYRPGFTERFICKTSSAGGQVEVRVENTGAVVLTDNNDSFTWVNLSPVMYRAEN